MTTSPAELLGNSRHISLETYRRSGAAVRTPVECLIEGGAIYARTMSTSGKARRLRNNPHLTVNRCDMRGKLLGPGFSATALFLPAAEAAAVTARFGQKYGLLWRTLSRLRKPRDLVLRIALDDVQPAAA